MRNLDLPDPFHPFFPFFLFLEKFSLARDVAAVALGEDVLAQRFDGFTGDHAISDRGLQGNFEHLAGDELLHLFHEHFAARVGFLAMHDQRKRVERLTIDQNVHLDQIAFAISDDLVIE